MPERLLCFVTMPYSPESDDLFEKAVLPALQTMQYPPVLVLRADQMPVTALSIKAHVESAVQSADFCIADITNGNPNVMYELGCAAAMRKPVFLIQDVRSEGTLPTDVASMQIQTYSRTELAEFAHRFARSAHAFIAKKVLSAERAAPPPRIVLADFLSQPDATVRFAASVKHTLSAVVVSPRSVLETIAREVNVSSRPGLLVRVVCADPEGQFVSDRARQLGRAVSAYRTDVWRQLRDLYALRERGNLPRFEIRLTGGTVSTSVVLSDTIGLAVPHFAAAVDRDAVVIEVIKEQSPMFFDMLRRQFRMAWEDGRTVVEDRSASPRNDE